VDTAQGSAYLSVFAQEKTPLDKLFEGAKLFVADNPLSHTAAAHQVLMASAASVPRGQNLSGKVLEFLERRFEGVSFSWNGAVALISISLNGIKAFVTFDPNQSLGEKSPLPEEPLFWYEKLRAFVVSLFQWIKQRVAVLIGFNVSKGPPLDDSGEPPLEEKSFQMMSPVGDSSQGVNKQKGFVWVDFENGLGRLLGNTDTNSKPSSSSAQLTWETLLKDPRLKDYAIVLKPNGEFEIHPRRHEAKDSENLYDAMRRVLALQERINVGFGGKLDEDGVPIPGRFFLNEGHAEVVLYRKKGQSRLLRKGESLIKALLDPEILVAAIQNPARAKRPGSNLAGKSAEETNRDPNSYMLKAKNILNKFPLECFLSWKSGTDTEWWFTPNPAAYFPNDPEGDPRDQLNHMTFSQSVSGASQSELCSLSSLTDIFEALAKVNSSEENQGKGGFIAAGNGWFSQGSEIKAGASQNVAHAHFLRIFLPIEHAPRTQKGNVGPVSVSVLGDPENGPGLVLEATQENRDQLVKVLFDTIKDITDRGLSYNFIIRQTSNGFRVFVAEKVRGIPDRRFTNEFAFIEFGRIGIIDRPDLFKKLTDEQRAALKDPRTNLTEWLKNEKKAGRLGEVDPELFKDLRAAIVSVSATAEAIEDLAQRVLDLSPSTYTQSDIVVLDSLLSRFLRGKEATSSLRAAGYWRAGRWMNDFLFAPVYETGLFFLLPFMVGALPGLAVGLVVFVGLHFWDDYRGALETGLSPPDALHNAVGLAVPRFLRSGVLYALPFLLFDMGFIFDSLTTTALSVSLLHSSRNVLREGGRLDLPKVISFLNLSWKSLATFSAVLLPQAAWANLNNFGDNGLLFQWFSASGEMGLAIIAWVLFGSFVSILIGRVMGNDGEHYLIERVKRVGLPYSREDELFGEAAIRAGDFETALQALFSARKVQNVAPKVIAFLEGHGQQERVQAIKSKLAEESADSHSTIMEKDESVQFNAKRMARVVVGQGNGVKEDLTRGQKEILDLFHQTFPHPEWIYMDSLDPRSLPLGMLRNVEEDLSLPDGISVFDDAFGEELEIANTLPLAPTLVLSRLRNFVDAAPDDVLPPAEQENRIPVEMQIVTMADMDLVRDTLTRLQSVNANEKRSIYLLLMGTDPETIKELQKATRGIPYVGVGSKPIAYETGGQSLARINPTRLGQQYHAARKKLSLPKGINLAVSVSDHVVLSQEEIKKCQRPGRYSQSLNRPLFDLIAPSSG
jgi:hypothetical protein